MHSNFLLNSFEEAVRSLSGFAIGMAPRPAIDDEKHDRVANEFHHIGIDATHELSLPEEDRLGGKFDKEVRLPAGGTYPSGVFGVLRVRWAEQDGHVRILEGCEPFAGLTFGNEVFLEESSMTLSLEQGAAVGAE